MEVVNVTTLAIAVAIGLERLFSRITCPGCHGFSHVDFSVSRCCALAVDRQQSPAGSPLPSMVHAPSAAEIERCVEQVIAQVSSRRGSLSALSPVSSNDLVKAVENAI